MDVQQFRHEVKERTHVASDEEAQRLIESALATLAERITANEARDLRSQLPDELQPLLETGAGERFSEEEFVRRFMVRADLDADRAGIRAAAVLGVVRDAVSAGEWADVLAQLPDDPTVALPGTAPAARGWIEMAEALKGRPTGSRWNSTSSRDRWQATTDDGMKQAEIRRTGGSFEARVNRYPTGPTGARPELSHGPQEFGTADEALDYAEAQLGWRQVH